MEAFALTSPLVTRSDGKKMGKTEKGALFLDPAMTSPYEFYQYWVNVPDADVEQFLLRFTFLPVAEISELCAAKDQRINEAKRRLARRSPRSCTARRPRGKPRRQPGPRSAQRAQKAAPPTSAGVPSLEIPRRSCRAGIGDRGPVRPHDAVRHQERRPPAGEPGRGVRGREERHGHRGAWSPTADAESGAILLRAGKKRYFRIIVS